MEGGDAVKPGTQTSFPTRRLQGALSRSLPATLLVLMAIATNSSVRRKIRQHFEREPARPVAPSPTLDDERILRALDEYDKSRRIWSILQPVAGVLIVAMAVGPEVLGFAGLGLSWVCWYCQRSLNEEDIKRYLAMASDLKLPLPAAGERGEVAVFYSNGLPLLQGLGHHLTAMVLAIEIRPREQAEVMQGVSVKLSDEPIAQQILREVEQGAARQSLFLMSSHEIAVLPSMIPISDRPQIEADGIPSPFLGADALTKLSALRKQLTVMPFMDAGVVVCAATEVIHDDEYLYLKADYHYIPPLRAEIHAVQDKLARTTTEWEDFVDQVSGLFLAPIVAATSVWKPFWAAHKWLVRREASYWKEYDTNSRFDISTKPSVQELLSGNKTIRYFEELEARLKIHSRMVEASVRRVFDAHGLSTNELERGFSQFINQGITMTGGNIQAGNIITGSAQTSAILGVVSSRASTQATRA